MPTSPEVQKYYDALLSSYDIVIDTLTRTSERGLTVSKMFAADVVKGQRESLELGKKLAAEPTDVMRFYGAVVESATAAQGRAMAFTKSAYEEVAAVGGDVRGLVEKLTEANKDTAGAAMEMARKYATANPMADAMLRSMDAVKPKASAKAAAAN